MNNKDLILKYLSGLLEGDELMKVQQKLENSADFREEFEKLSANLNSLAENSQIKYDNRYFASSLVKAKRKAVSGTKRRRFVPALSAASLAALFLFFFLSAPVDEGEFFNTDELYSALLEVDSAEMNDFMKHDMVSYYSYYGDIETELDMGSNSSDINSGSTDSYSMPYNYNYDVLNDASTEEIEQLYNTILETKIL